MIHADYEELKHEIELLRKQNQHLRTLIIRQGAVLESIGRPKFPTVEEMESTEEEFRNDEVPF